MIRIAPVSSAPETVRVFPSREALAEAAADLLLVQMRARRGRILLSGASLPRSTFRRIASQATASDYRSVHLFFSDERMVPADHPESVYGTVKRAWLAPSRFPPERVHRIVGDVTAERAAHLAEEELRAVTGEPPRLDLALLGLGRDGHTAALYPGVTDASDTDRLYAPARGGARVTATFTLLAACQLVVFAVSGADRAEAVRAALHDPPGAVPASLVASPGRVPLWLLDRDAASRLS